MEKVFFGLLLSLREGLVEAITRIVNFKKTICARSGGTGAGSMASFRTVSHDLPTMCCATLSKQNICVVAVPFDPMNVNLYLNICVVTVPSDPMNVNLYLQCYTIRCHFFNLMLKVECVCLSRHHVRLIKLRKA